jgi:hypothetical protein
MSKPNKQSYFHVILLLITRFKFFLMFLRVFLKLLLKFHIIIKIYLYRYYYNSAKCPNMALNIVFRIRLKIQL